MKATHLFDLLNNPKYELYYYDNDINGESWV